MTAAEIVSLARIVARSLPKPPLPLDRDDLVQLGCVAALRIPDAPGPLVNVAMRREMIDAIRSAIGRGKRPERVPMDEVYDHPRMLQSHDGHAWVDVCDTLDALWEVCWPGQRRALVRIMDGQRDGCADSHMVAARRNWRDVWGDNWREEI